MIPFLDINKINQRFKTDFHGALDAVLDKGQFIKGDFVSQFENEFAAYCGTDYCIGTGNGLDALSLILKSYIALGKLNKGDEVIVPANTFIATIISVINAELIPVLVEPHLDTYTIDVSKVEAVISPNTKAIIAVHLYGQLADMSALQQLAEKHNVLLLEDAAQAHGAVSPSGKKSGNLSNAAAFSFYPTKNLGALGDGGAVCTNDAILAKTVAQLGNYGSLKKHTFDGIGVNSRLDALQAVFSSVKLKHLDADNKRRIEIAETYNKGILNSKIKLPLSGDLKTHVYHLYVVRVANRDAFIHYLKTHAIETQIHYPIPPHKQKALSNIQYGALPITEKIHREVLSLPMSPVMTNHEMQNIIRVINSY